MKKYLLALMFVSFIWARRLARHDAVDIAEECLRDRHAVVVKINVALFCLVGPCIESSYTPQCLRADFKVQLGFCLLGE